MVKSNLFQKIVSRLWFLNDNFSKVPDSFVYLGYGYDIWYKDVQSLNYFLEQHKNSDFKLNIRIEMIDFYGIMHIKSLNCVTHVKLYNQDMIAELLLKFFEEYDSDTYDVTRYKVCIPGYDNCEKFEFTDWFMENKNLISEDYVKNKYSK